MSISGRGRVTVVRAGSAVRVRGLVVDRDGRVLEDPLGRGPDRRRSVAELLPDTSPEAFSTWCAALETTPAGALVLDLPMPGGMTMALRLSRADGPGRYRFDLDEGGTGASYRDRLEQRLTFEHLVATLSTELIHAPAGRLDALIEEALGRIGRLFGVDRAYLFRFSSDRSSYSNSHEWVEEGVTREAGHLQHVPTTHFPWLLGELMADRAVHVPVVTELPEAAVIERTEFEREGIQSLALVPMGDAGAPEGFIGFDSVRRQRHWPSDILLGLRLVGQMFSNAFRAREMSERLVQYAYDDPLTGMGNRRFLSERLTLALRDLRRTGGRLAVILIDLDDFKLVNDSYGHRVGDEVLQAAGARLASALRASDVIGRLGGDEFVVVARADRVAPPTGLIRRLFDAMAEPAQLHGEAFALRMTMGVALAPDHGIDAETLLHQADTAMYAAKAGGKNRFRFFDPGMTRDSRASLRLRHDLRLAIERGEFEPYYQPRVDLASGRVIGFEALARWNHPARGLLMPDAFLELARGSGVVGEIDLQMLSQATGQLQAWRRHAPALCVSVNLDAQALYDEPLIARLLGVLAGSAGGASGIEIEITESSLIRDIARASATLHRLREAAPGLRIAIDDFGTGYSSLGYIGRLPIDTLKIDRSFTADLTSSDPRSARAVIETIIGLGRNVGLRLVAEGVELPAQAELLAEMGCQEAQGYLFSPPVPADAAVRYLP